MSQFYNPWLPGWLGLVLVVGLFILGGYKITQWRKDDDSVNLVNILAGLGLWVGAAVMGLMAVGVSEVNADWLAGTGSPSGLLITASWIVPVVAFGMFVHGLLFKHVLQRAVAFLVICGSFTLTAYTMLMVTDSGYWALTTSYSWMATGASVLALLAIAAYLLRRGLPPFTDRQRQTGAGGGSRR